MRLQTRPPILTYLLTRWYAIPCGPCVPRARSGCPSGIPCVSFGCACARALAASAPPPPPRARVARAPCAVPVLGAGRAVPLGPCPSACPASVPCSVWLAWEGGGPAPFPPYLAWGCALPVGWVRVSGAFQRWEVGFGGGRPARRPPRWRGGQGQWGGGLSYLGPSLCLPWAGNNAGVFGVALAMEGVAPIPLRFMPACCPRGWSVWRPCALARVRLPIAVPAGAGGWGRGGGSCCAPPPPRAPRSFRRRGNRPVCLGGGGGGGAAPPWPAGRWGGVGGQGGGSRAVVLHLPPLTPLRCRYVFGRGRGVAPGAGRGLPPAGQPRGGGVEGRPVCRPPRRSGRGA